MVDNVQTARSLEDEQAVLRNLVQLADEAKDIVDSLAALQDVAATKNTKQSSIAALSYTSATISATFIQAEVQQLSTDIGTLSNKIDAVILALQSADILT